MQPHSPRFVLLATLALPATFPPALAHSPAPAQMPETTVVQTGSGADYAPATSGIGAKSPLLLRDIPQSLTVINRAVLDAQAATSMTEALRNVPGLTISAGEGGAIGDNINLRGFSARTDVYLDGMRDRGQYTRDTFNLEAVEVLKGPSSMQFGRGSTGGVLNQSSKKPGLKPGAELRASLGTSSSRRLAAGINRPLSDSAAWRLETFAQNVGSTRENVLNRGWGLAPSLRLGIGGPTELSLSALLQRNFDTPDYGFPFVAGPDKVRKPVAAPAGRNYGYSDDRFDQAVNVFSARLRHKAAAGWTLVNQTQYNRNTTEASPSPLGAVTRIGGGVPTQADPLSLLSATRQDRDRRLDDRSLYNQTDLSFPFQTGAVRHTFNAGLELGRERSREQRFVWSPTNVPVNLGSPNFSPRPGVRALSRTLETDASTVAVSLNDQVAFDSHWKVVAGLRRERFAASTTLNKATLPPGFPADTSIAPAAQTVFMGSYRIGAIYQPNETQSWYLSSGNSFNPSAEAVSQPASTAMLPPEQSRALEAGAKLDWLDGNLSFNAALFQIVKENARTSSPQTGLVSLDGRLRVRGVELGLVGRITPNWQVLAGVTLLDGKILKSFDTGTGADAGLRAEGKQMQNTPRRNASLWSTVRLGQGWEAGGGLVHASRRTLNNYGTAVVDGYTRWDATLAYVQPTWDLRLNLQNIGDAHFFEVASGGRATPAKGRSVTAGLTVRF